MSAHLGDTGAATVTIEGPPVMLPDRSKTIPELAPNVQNSETAFMQSRGLPVFLFPEIRVFGLL